MAAMAAVAAAATGLLPLLQDRSMTVTMASCGHEQRGQQRRAMGHARKELHQARLLLKQAKKLADE
jgi:hypothetical protein